MRDKPRILHTETLVETRLFRIEQLDLRFANGVETRYERLVGARGAVLIVPLLDDDTVLLIREYAAGTDRYELGLPKGRIEDGEEVLAAANREIMEEVGYGAGHLQQLATLSMAPGYVGHLTYVVLARNLYPQKNDGDEPEEHGTSHFVAIDHDGNAVSYTSTVEGSFGSGIMVGGYYLNNELTDFSFSSEANGQPVANRVEGGKRPRSSMAPTLVYDAQGKLVLAVGAAGGATIPVQVARAGDPAPGFQMKGAIVIDPLELTAKGPRSIVDVMQFVRSAPFDVSGLTEGTYRRPLPLDRPPNLVSFDPESVIAMVEIGRELVTKQFTKLKVEVIGAPRATTKTPIARPAVRAASMSRSRRPSPTAGDGASSMIFW